MNRLPAEPLSTGSAQMRVMFRMWTVTRTLRRAQSAECGWTSEIDVEALVPLRNAVGNPLRDGPCATQAQEILAGLDEMTDEEQLEAFTRAMRVSASDDCTVSDVAVVEESPDEEEMDIEEGDEFVDQITEETMMEHSSFLEQAPGQAFVIYYGALFGFFILYALVLGVLCFAFQYVLMFVISALVCAFRYLVNSNDNSGCLDVALARFQSRMSQVLRTATCAVPVAYGASIGAFLSTWAGVVVLAR